MNIGKQAKADERWEMSEGMRLMQKVIEVKAEQVTDFRETLKRKTGKLFVEATYNKIWGSGIPISSEKAANDAEWPGKNMLGNMLTELSKALYSD